jgi:hypothetical protein
LLLFHELSSWPVKIRVWFVCLTNNVAITYSFGNDYMM